jgi:hypothetical protein
MSSSSQMPSRSRSRVLFIKSPSVSFALSAVIGRRGGLWLEPSAQYSVFSGILLVRVSARASYDRHL